MQISDKVYSMVRHCEGLLSIMMEREVELVISMKGQQVTEAMIREMVCASFDLPWSAVKSKCRKRIITTARQCYCYLCTIYLTVSDNDVAQSVNIDRTTVISSRQNIAEYLETGDEYVTQYLGNIIQQLNALPSKQNHYNNEKLQHKA